MLQLNLRASEGVEIQSKGNPRESSEERWHRQDDRQKRMSRTAELGRSTSRGRLQVSGYEATGAWL